VRQPEQGVAHDAADGAHVARQQRRDALRDGMGRYPGEGGPLPGSRVPPVAYDPVSRKLSGVAPVAPELVAAFARFEHLTLTELQEQFAAADARFRAWVREHPERPIAEAPDYLDRIALDSLLERRTWAE
jgi:hypothetical protein